MKNSICLLSFNPLTVKLFSSYLSLGTKKYFVHSLTWHQVVFSSLDFRHQIILTIYFSANGMIWFCEKSINPM